MDVHPLNKYNKLKRFASYVSESMREGAKDELSRVDCLNNADIYTRRDLWEKLNDIAECANLVELRKYETGEIVIHNANFCHNPVVCPVCADRVSKRRRAIFSEPIKRAVRRFAVDPTTGDWKSDFPAGYTGVYLATATIKDGENLKERIDVLQDAVKRMRKKGQRRRRAHGAARSPGEWSKVRAGISNTEIKIGSGSNRWHVHVHFLIFTDSPIDIKTRDSSYFIKKENGEKVAVSKFNYEWYESTKGQGINFDLKPVSYRKNVNGIECETMEESIVAQSQEVIKYATVLSKKKGTGLLSARQYVELIQRRGTRRLFNTLGLLRCDKRNPESFTTITERELRRLEYIDETDKKCYEVFSALWNNGGTYSKMSKQESAVFANSDDMKTRWINIRRRAFLAQTAKYQGEYRRERNALFKNRLLFLDKELFESLLDASRDSFRRRVSTLWQKMNDNTFIPEFLTDFNSTGMQGYREQSLLKAA